MKTAKKIIFSVLIFSSLIHNSHALPSKYTDLNDYVVAAPNQGQVNTCLFMAATGAMEILLSKKMGIKSPAVFSEVDLSERYTISEVPSARSKTWFENAFLKFDSGKAILAKDLPFESFDEAGNINYSVWNIPNAFKTAPRIQLPAVDTVHLFSFDKYARGVLNESHARQVKAALVQYESPVIVVGNDEDYWHVVVITGYDDDAVGECYELDSKVCIGKKGAFYVRDSFGTRLETRSYEWFIRRLNSAAVAKLR